jgi:hypothetical protein
MSGVAKSEGDEYSVSSVQYPVFSIQCSVSSIQNRTGKRDTEQCVCLLYQKLRSPPRLAASEFCGALEFGASLEVGRWMLEFSNAIVIH